MVLAPSWVRPHSSFTATVSVQGGEAAATTVQLAIENSGEGGHNYSYNKSVTVPPNSTRRVQLQVSTQRAATRLVSDGPPAGYTRPLHTRAGRDCLTGLHKALIVVMGDCLPKVFFWGSMPAELARICNKGQLLQKITVK